MQYGFSQNLKFTFRLSPRVQFTRTLSEHMVLNEKAVPYEQLPESFRDEVESEVARLREQYKQFLRPPNTW